MELGGLKLLRRIVDRVHIGPVVAESRLGTTHVPLLAVLGCLLPRRRRLRTPYLVWRGGRTRSPRLRRRKVVKSQVSIAGRIISTLHFVDFENGR